LFKVYPGGGVGLREGNARENGEGENQDPSQEKSRAGSYMWERVSHCRGPSTRGNKEKRRGRKISLERNMSQRVGEKQDTL